MKALRLTGALAMIALLAGLASCAPRRPDDTERATADTTLAGINAAQVPGWPRDDVAFFLHGSMSAEFVPERALTPPRWRCCWAASSAGSICAPRCTAATTTAPICQRHSSET